MYEKEDKRTYLAIFVHSPVPRIYVHVVLDQRMDML
jgi:hypothetical protein